MAPPKPQQPSLPHFLPKPPAVTFAPQHLSFFNVIFKILRHTLIPFSLKTWGLEGNAVLFFFFLSFLATGESQCQGETVAEATDARLFSSFQISFPDLRAGQPRAAAGVLTRKSHLQGGRESEAPPAPPQRRVHLRRGLHGASLGGRQVQAVWGHKDRSAFAGYG